jgi:hypothetical protein
MQIGSTQSNQISQNYYTRVKSDDSTPDNQKSTQEKDKQQTSQDPSKLTDDEKIVVKELQARDTEVRAHEAAHQAAGGGMTGGASYTYEKGPDGRMYAIGGEVSISTKGGSNPQETIANARQVEAAAMAPANPSGQDFAVASSAKIMEMKAQQELTKERQEQTQGTQAYKDASNQQETPAISLDISA